MEKYELLKIAQSTGIAAEQIARWHIQEGPLYVSANPGRPKGKIKRPAGCISIGDARRKYNLKTAQLQKWREEGLPTVTSGTMVAIKESELKRWIATRK